MPDSAARFKTIAKNDCDIRTDHSRIDVLATQILGRLGDRSKKRAYVFTHRPLRSERWVAQLLLSIFCFLFHLGPSRTLTAADWICRPARSSNYLNFTRVPI